MAHKSVLGECNGHCKNNGALEAASKTTIKTGHIVYEQIRLIDHSKCYCYIANAKTKRDWLIRGHVALDKCNVSPRETSKKLLPGYEYRKNKMAA